MLSDQLLLKPFGWPDIWGKQAMIITRPCESSLQHLGRLTSEAFCPASLPAPLVSSSKERGGGMSGEGVRPWRHLLRTAKDGGVARGPVLRTGFYLLSKNTDETEGKKQLRNARLLWGVAVLCLAREILDMLTDISKFHFQLRCPDKPLKGKTSLSWPLTQGEMQMPGPPGTGSAFLRR